MSVSSETDRGPFVANDLHSPASSQGAADEFLAPIIAGAFARGVAETFNTLAVPALLLDRDGRVLFCSVAAQVHLTRGLTLQSGHLLACARTDNDMLAAFMAEILREPGQRRALTLACCGVTLSTVTVPGAATPIVQLLHAIVVLGSVDEGAEAPPGPDDAQPR